MPYSGTLEERRRKERERKRRSRAVAKAVRKTAATRSQVKPHPEPRPVPNPVPFSEGVRAGQVAGLLEAALRMPRSAVLIDEAAVRDWLAAHPVGASIVSELLAVAGLLEPFRRWRG